MNDLSCAAEIYALMRNHVDNQSLTALSEEVVDIMVEEGYSFAKIEEALGDFDEIYDAIESYVQEEDESEVEMEDEEDDYDYEMAEDFYSDEE